MVGGYHYFILQGEMDEQETNRFSILPGDPKQASGDVAISLEFQSLEHPPQLSIHTRSRPPSPHMHNSYLLVGSEKVLTVKNLTRSPL